MSTFHSTLSRREFIKGLGLASAGVGVASAINPGFHDLDEAIASSASELGSTTSMMKRPWWVKEIDKPTVEIDLKLRTPFTGVNAATGLLGGIHVSKEEQAAVLASMKKNMEEGAKNNRPGWTLRDQIATRAGYDRANYVNKSHPNQGFRSIITYADLGVPKYQGTPEENALMMRTTLASFGASKIGYAELDDTNVGPRRSLFMPNEIGFDDIDDYKMNNKVTVIPNKCKYAITIYGKRSAIGRFSTNSPQYMAFYVEKFEWVGRVQNFLWGLGFQSYLMGDAGIVGTNPPVWSILSGMGEYNRTHNPPATPEGDVGEGGIMLITDLPLSPTKPIDFGVLRFCQNCGVCAEVCPAGAIPTLDEMKEPTWEINTGPWSASNDHKGYPNHSLKCATYNFGSCAANVFNRPVGNCGRCASFCVFNQENDAWIHQVVKATASNTPLFNSFFAEMDRTAGYHEEASDEVRESFWTKYPSKWK